MNKYELFAVCHYLSSWPENMPFQELLEALTENNQDIEITVCETYELYPPEDIANFMSEMADSLKNYFGGKF